MAQNYIDLDGSFRFTVCLGLKIGKEIRLSIIAFTPLFRNLEIVLWIHLLIRSRFGFLRHIIRIPVLVYGFKSELPKAFDKTVCSF